MQITDQKISLFWFILLFSVSFSSLCYALRDDKKEKVYIVGDRALINYKTGIKIFEGNVKIDQGTTHVTADKIVTKDNHKHKIQEATAYGIKQRAHYWTLPRLNDLKVHAYAHVIKFYPETSNITLKRDAYVVQGDNSFKGELIFYNQNDQTITVPQTKNGKAVIVYNPDN